MESFWFVQGLWNNLGFVKKDKRIKLALYSWHPFAVLWKLSLTCSWLWRFQYFRSNLSLIWTRKENVRSRSEIRYIIFVVGFTREINLSAFMQKMKILGINHAFNTCFMRYAPRLNLEFIENWNAFLLKHELNILFRTDSNTDTNFLESTKKSPQTLLLSVVFKRYVI